MVCCQLAANSVICPWSQNSARSLGQEPGSIGNAMIRYALLIRFFREQALYISVSVVVAAIFWAVGQPINPLTILLYSLCIGNLLTPSLSRLSCLFRGRPFLYNWLVFLFHAIQDVIVILMASDPKPPKVVFSPERNSSVGSPDINRPDISFALKPKRRMLRISFEKLVLLDGQVLDLSGKLCEEPPKA